MYFPRAYSEKLHPAASAHDPLRHSPSGRERRPVYYMIDGHRLGFPPFTRAPRRYLLTHTHTPYIILCVCACAIYYNVLLCMPDKTKCTLYIYIYINVYRCRMQSGKFYTATALAYIYSYNDIIFYMTAYTYE